MLNVKKCFRLIIKNKKIQKDNYFNNPISLCEFKV